MLPATAFPARSLGSYPFFAEVSFIPAPQIVVDFIKLKSDILWAHAYSSAMPFSANSFFAFSFLAKCIRPIPRSTLGALVNWMLS